MGISLSAGLWIVIGLLSITAVAACVLMIMMMLGKKAVSYATGLSFVVSILAHLALVSAWFAWYLYTELNPQAAVAAETRLGPQETAEVLEIESASDEVSPDVTDSKLEERREITELPPLERMVPEEVTPIPEPIPERTATASAESPSIDIPDSFTPPEVSAAVPEPMQSAPIVPQVIAQIPIEVETPERVARPESKVPETPLERSEIPTVSQQDDPLERSAREGTVNRIEIEPETKMATPDLNTEPDAPLPRRDETFDLSNLKGPTPSLAEAPDLGTELPSENETGKVGDSDAPDIERTKLTEPIVVAGGSLDRQRPEFPPAFPAPTAEGVGVTPPLASLNLPSVGPSAPNVLRPDFDRPMQTSESVPKTYRLRSIERRAEVARKFGGTQESEKAVENALAWLARHQDELGFWDASKYGSGRGPNADVADLNLPEDRKRTRQQSGIQADTGVSALSLLAFLAAGYTNEEGQYADNVDRAIRWLMSQQRADGFVGGASTYFAANYSHGMVTYALAEALGMQSNPDGFPELRKAVRDAVNYSISIQLSVDGGWRYSRSSTEGDMSLFGWHLMAIKSAEIAGVPIPETVRQRLIGFLRDRSLGPNKGLAAYRPGEQITPAMTAEALFCKQILGIKRDNPQSQEAASYLLQHRPRLSQWNLYYWYYGTLAMYQFGGTEWELWNSVTRDVLVDAQRNDGDLAGSWDPIGPWGPYGGRVYSTALGALCLEVYYRFLPLYEHSGQFDE